MRSMKLSKYFEVVKPTYTALKIIPSTGTRNYNSGDIAKMINGMYKDISRSIRRIEKKYVFETSVKCSYVIDITKYDVGFFLIVPKQYKHIAEQKISGVWPKATVLEDEIPSINNDNITTYQLTYRNMDAFSLKVDKKANSTLNSVLNVIDIMESADRVSICYNFMPYRNSNWQNMCKSGHNKYINGESITRSFDIRDLGLELLNQILNVIGGVLEGMGGGLRAGSPLDQLRNILGNKKREISDITLKKSSLPVIQTQIAVVSSSDNIDRSSRNAVSVCQGFSVLDGDNELMYKRAKPINLLDYRYDKVDILRTSMDECHNFIQLPGRELLKDHNIKHINITETKIPEELRQGYIKVGKSTYRGSTVQTFTSPDKEIANLPFVFVGPMGAGKTFQNLQYAKDVIEAGEGLIVLDYIKQCELACEIEKITPKDRLIVLDLSREEDLQSFAFNEFKLTGDTIKDKMKCANKHQQAITELIDAIYMGDPLSGQMRKYFTSAADVVLINKNTSLSDVISCLEDYDVRETFIKSIPEGYMEYLSDSVKTLRELDDKDKKTGEITGTKYSKVEHIIDRINVLRETLEMKLMFKKPSSSNIDFAKAMDEGKVILIKMNSDYFGSEHVKNVLVTFFINKIWIACNARGAQKELRRCHVLLDEIFQAPTAYHSLRLILKQCRKFRLRLVFTAQMLGDLHELNDGLKSAGASYLLMQKCDPANFDYLKHEFVKHDFSIEDLLNLKRYHSLNLICYSDGYAAYESDLEIK